MKPMTTPIRGMRAAAGITAALVLGLLLLCGGIALADTALPIATDWNGQPVVLAPAAPAVTPLIDYLMAGIHALGVVLVAAIAGWARTHIKNLAVRTAFDGAVKQGAAGIYEELVASESTWSNLPIRNVAIANAVSHVLQEAPGALKTLGITPDDVASIVTKQFGQLLAADPGVTVGPKLEMATAMFAPGEPVQVFPPASPAPAPAPTVAPVGLPAAAPASPSALTPSTGI